MRLVANVNILDEKLRAVSFLAGDEVPEWAVSRISPALLVDSAEPSEAAVEDADSGMVSLSGLRKAELVAWADENGFDSSGTKAEILARVEAGDKVANKAGSETVDVWALSDGELRALGETHLGADAEGMSSDEIAAVLEARLG